MNWYYMSGGASGERKGPIPHHHFLTMVQQGKIPQATLASSPELTGGKWVAVKDIPMLREGREAEAPPHHAVDAPPPRGVASPPDQRATARPASVADQPYIQSRPQPSLHVRPVFQRYWMPDYIQAIWYLTLAFGALWFLVVLVVALRAASLAEELDQALISLAVPTLLSLLGIAVSVLGVRFVLELYAIFFDIRSFMKRQTDLLEQKSAKEMAL